MTTPTNKLDVGAMMTDELIRKIFMSHGFTIKEGQTDLKPYVYAAARALLSASKPAAPTQPCGDAEQADEVVTREQVEQWANLAGLTAFGKLKETGYDRLGDFAILARQARASLTAEKVAQAEPVPVEVWHGERKVTIYPDCVLRVWGTNIESEMSDAPRTLQSVQDAMDWLYAAPPAQTQVALTDERINKAIVTWFDDRGFEHDFERRMRNALLAALPEIDSGRAAIAQAEVKT